MFSKDKQRVPAFLYPLYVGSISKSKHEVTHQT